MNLLTKSLALALSATTFTTSLPIPLTSRSDSATCYNCGKSFSSNGINIAIDRFCVNGLQGFPSAQQVFEYLFYTNYGGMGSLALGIRATGGEGCPRVIEMTEDACKKTFWAIGEACTDGRGGAWREQCLEFEVNSNIVEGVPTESSCGAVTIWAD